MMSMFHFLRPEWFIALLPSLILLWAMSKKRRTNKHWESVCDPQLLPYILVGKISKTRNTALVLTGIAGLLSIVALAGPTWERLPQPVFQKKSALVIALDLSFSMYADDIKPSRLEHAQFKLADLLNMRKEGLTALIVYAGDAFTVTPLTDDIKTIKSQLTALSPDIMPAPGSNTARAMDKATNLLKQGGMSQGHILFVTDEIDKSYKNNFIDALSQGYQISILAIGTEQGAPIKLNDGSYLKDRNSSIIIPRLDEINLKKMVSSGGGRYEKSTIADTGIQRLNSFFNQTLEQVEEKKSKLKSDQWRDFGPWIVLLIIPLMALMFRSGYLTVLLAVLLIRPEPAVAFDFKSLWLNKNQQAMQAMEQGQTKQAAELFQDEEWRAIAKYRAGDYAAAQSLLDKKSDARSQYNLANALARQGNYEAAIAAYENVIEQQPENEDAQYNKKLIEEELKKQQQSKQNENRESSDNQEQQARQESDSEGQQSRPEQDENSSNTEQSKQESKSSEAQNQKNNEQQQAKDKQSAGQQQPDETNDLTESPSEQEQTENEKPIQQQLSQQDLSEEQQASEQWLRRIPDDPAGLLRRKFQYQYQQQKQQQARGQYW